MNKLQQIDNMDGHEFEYFCADILKNNGFRNVKVTRGSGDFGVDIVAQYKDKKYAIQCKCYSHKLDNSPIQEVVAGMSSYGCNTAAVMTNQFFTEPAKVLAKRNNVELWDRDALSKMIDHKCKINSKKTSPKTKVKIFTIIAIVSFLASLVMYTNSDLSSFDRIAGGITYDVAAIIFLLLSIKFRLPKSKTTEEIEKEDYLTPTSLEEKNHSALNAVKKENLTAHTTLRKEKKFSEPLITPQTKQSYFNYNDFFNELIAKKDIDWEVQCNKNFWSYLTDSGVNIINFYKFYCIDLKMIEIDYDKTAWIIYGMKLKSHTKISEIKDLLDELSDHLGAKVEYVYPTQTPHSFGLKIFLPDTIKCK